VGRRNSEHTFIRAHVGKRTVQDSQVHKREKIRTLREERGQERTRENICILSEREERKDSN
jgi:hypothetical protein